jgi:DNA invertase Pin-like site-specific DNA recombinase
MTRRLDKTAFAYLRSATRPQAGTSQNLTRQRENIQRTAAALGIEVIKQFADHGISGRTLERPAMKQMIQDIESGDYNLDYVMVDRPDRLAQNFDGYIWFMNMLKRNGVRLIYAAPE